MVSWLWLRGQCRTCHAPFSARYLIVEAVTGALFGIAWYATVDLGVLFESFDARLVRFAVYAAFAFVMVVVSFIDLDHKLILDKVTLPSIAIFYGLGLVVGRAWTPGLVGALLGYLLPWAIGEIYWLVTGREGLGLGDSKLLAVVGALLGVPLLAAVLWLMDRMGGLWWLYVWMTWVSFNLLVLVLYPTVIAPLFNRFSPLSDPDLVARIEGLLARTGFASAGLFVMDASKRSGHGNAYFTGLGPVKRIVFFDTLLTQLDGAQIEAVLAHELGHDKKNHIPKMVLAMAVLSFVGFAFIGWLMQQSWLYTSLGVQLPSTAAALILAIVCLPACTFMLDPLQAWWSRRHEFEADAYAVAHTSVDAMAGALVSIYRENAGTLTPDPLYAAWHYSHPPASERVAHIRRLSVS